jgi:glycosyltransferase involved in cell wall biosynthesis
MPRYISVADAGVFFINPYKKIGSSPIKMGEFLASGIPVVINPGVGDTEELVLDNKVGVVIRQFDRGCYIDAARELVEIKKGGQALISRCRAAAEKHLSLELAADKYAKIYALLTEKRR